MYSSLDIEIRRNFTKNYYNFTGILPIKVGYNAPYGFSFSCNIIMDVCKGVENGSVRQLHIPYVNIHHQISQLATSNLSVFGLKKR